MYPHLALWCVTTGISFVSDKNMIRKFQGKNTSLIYIEAFFLHNNLKVTLNTTTPP